MYAIWETKVLEIPLFKKLVGLKYKNQRPLMFVITEHEYEQLIEAGEFGIKYKLMIDGATRKCRT